MSRLFDRVALRAAGNRFVPCCALFRAKRVLNFGTRALLVSSTPCWWRLETANSRPREPGAAKNPRRSQATLAASVDGLQSNAHRSGAPIVSLPLARVLDDCPPRQSPPPQQVQKAVELEGASKEAHRPSLNRVSEPQSALVTEYYPNGYTPDEVEIAAFLRRNCWYHVQSRYAKNELYVKCPESHQATDLLATGRLSREDGSFYCTGCKLRGGWACFANRAAAVSPAAQLARLAAQNEINSFHDAYADVKNYPKNLQALSEKMIRGLEESTGITRETLKKYGVGYVTWPAMAQVNRKADSQDVSMESCPPEVEGVGHLTLPAEPQINRDLEGRDAPPSYITFPRTGIVPAEGKDPQVIRLRLLPYDHYGINHDKSAIMDPTKEPVTPGLFGLHTVALNQAKVTICGSEIDAMAVHQATGEPAVALDRLNQLPLTVLPLLERFVRIDIWLEDTPAGRAAAESHANKLGVNRTWIVSTLCDRDSGPLTPSEALRKGYDLVDIKMRAEKLAHKDVLRFSDLRRHVHQFILNPQSFAGIKSHILPDLDRILKGLRRGELTIVTGATGIGKTTVLSHLSVDYAMSGVPVVWGSFEIPNHVLLRKMLDQLAAKPLVKHQQEFALWADKLETLPMYFLDFFSSTAVDKVIGALSHAVYAHDAGLVVIDNLQFMMSGQSAGSLDKWSLQDAALHALRRFATLRNVHLALVVHPRKEDGELRLSSIYGSVKTTQEADNVIILQSKNGWDYLEFVKQRHDGTLGKVGYKIDSESKALRGLTTSEKTSFFQCVRSLDQCE